MEYKNFEEFYNRAYDLAQQAKHKEPISKQAIVLARKTFSRSDLNSFYHIENLSSKHIAMLGTKERTIKLSIDSMIKNILEHPDLDFDDYLKLKSIVRNPDKFLQDRKSNLRIFKKVDGKFYEVIIKTTESNNENFLTTFHRCDKTKLKDKKR